MSVDPRRLGLNSLKAERARRDGLRHTIFTPQASGSLKEKYRGEWLRDRKNGKGASLSRDTWLYEGDWSNGQRHGYGILSKQRENGDFLKSYAGYWSNGKRHGLGCRWYEDGSYYEGSFARNLRDGEGRAWFADSAYYQGAWKDDFFDGWGLLVQADGNRYEGEFLGGLREGYGKFYLLQTGQVHEGRWKTDVCTSGVIRDTRWRQSAPRPTQYPIPKITTDATLSCC